MSLNDPDQGTWSYQYSLFNDLTQQEDALGQRTEMTYDALGRMLNRVDKKAGGTVIEGNTSWVYDSASNGLGKVSTVTDSASGYVMAYDYDDLGRIHQTYTSLGTNGSEGNFSQLVTYDQIGRVFQEIDATNHGVQYFYNSHGYMEKIAEATDTTKVYKRIESANAWGNETQSMLGNGLKVQSTYHATMGLPDRVLVTNPSTQTIQDNSYDYNDIGILTNRSRFVKSNNSTLSETFHYDELNRLTQATATGLPTQSFQYDIKGNITYKSDVGNYTYGAGNAGPHAVTSAASDNYTYDATGNMLTGGGRTVTYNTFRKPLTLSKGTHTSTFTYGPDRSHYKRVDADGTTVKTTFSIGNVEFITHSSGVTETKRYIADIAVVTDSSIAGHSEHYTHKDTLGSTDIVTNSVGGVVAEMSFDAFGKRRNVLTLAELAEAQYDVLNAITTKGFTSHEMVDEVGIIHMGGRIYDPELGRFMSADPIVSDMTNLQRLNRYSYVLNSPLSFTDPTGFDNTNNCPGGICGDIYGYITVTATSGGGVSSSMVFGSGSGGYYNSGSSSTGAGTSPPPKQPDPSINGAATEEVAPAVTMPAAPTTTPQTNPVTAGTAPDTPVTPPNEVPPQIISPKPVPPIETLQTVDESSEESGGWWSNALDVAQVVLGGVGIIPGVGIGADLVVGVIAGFRGDWAGVGLSILSAIPILEYGVGAARIIKSADNYVDLASSQRRNHILNGDVTGGGHRPGTGNPGKSEFPQGWSDDKIMHEISDIATDPNSITHAGRGGRTITEGTRDGINIRVIQESSGDIVSGFPTNVPRNLK